MKEMICIEDTWYAPGVNISGWVHPKKGEIVYVIEAYIADKKYYRLFGYNDPLRGYDAKYFVPAPDISELTEVLNAETCEV